MNDEVNQVMGFTHVGDLSAISPAYLTLFTPTEFATLIKWGEVKRTKIYLFLFIIDIFILSYFKQITCFLVYFKKLKITDFIFLICFIYYF